MNGMPEVDHLGFSVSDFDAAKAFYEVVLATLGWTKAMEFEGDGYKGVGFGRDGKPVLWLQAGGKMAPRLHLAFSAPNRAAVDAFYNAALKAGGKDNGPPGVRKEYHPNYYAAFVLDLDGHNIEAVIHAPVGAAAAKKPAKRVAKTAKKTAKVAAKPAKKQAKTAKKAGKAEKKASKKQAKKGGKKKRK